ncbi:MAG: TRAP transporter large permease subunit [Rhodospirillales bacterium]|jgi:tripartite ATP-independent transporter DctM subunit|nr:TRAP transporter large permease subunit [Rhodospirillales bacterium]MBT4007174.1 TRAP transporter large permease subunit [Rhodospirillales bacterium]MBT5076055.1 TRAP transporter large permease subunit [Rhodospirillales bacterium]MBT5113507.1 TRAP transporter large permease subunit [Rhodospirillales bacterium]MBT5673805.1 TRAP transporter large permease subunit [Rhodospirillales bacterium]
MSEYMALGLFAVTCLFLLGGFPVAFTLSGTALLFAAIGAVFGIMDFGLLGAYAQQIFGRMTNPVLIAVPLFIFMGVMLERSRVAEELLDTMGALFGRLRGGLGISVTLVGALLAASTGIIGATVVTMGLLSLPTMLRRGYDPGLAAGSICAAGTLGQIIPPSIVLILLGEVLSSSYQQAQLQRGIFAPDTVSVGDLFAGAVLPGVLLVVLYIAYQGCVAWLRPNSSPAIPDDGDDDIAGSMAARVLRVLVPPLALIVSVLGSILGGIATPTEAAAVGAVGATLLAAFKIDKAARVFVTATLLAVFGLLVLTLIFDLRFGRDEISGYERVAIGVALVLSVMMGGGIFMAFRRVSGAGILAGVMESTLRITAMVFVIFIGAALFSLVFRGLGGDALVHNFLSNLPGGSVGAMVFVMVLMFVLGFFLDFIEIIYVVVPIVAVPLMVLGLDPIWLGIMIAVNLQASFLTPPFGFALFYLRGVAPKEVTTLQIYRGVAPFVVIQLFALAIMAAFPMIVLWLPKLIYG